MPRHRSRAISIGSLAAVCTVGALLTSAPAWAIDGEDAPVAVTSQLGAYLSGRTARGAGDARAAAAYYDMTLGKDPGNSDLAAVTFDMELTDGNWTRAEELARSLAADHSDHRIAELFLGLVDFKRSSYDAAEDHFIASAQNPIGELVSLLSRAWLRVERGQGQAALDLIDGAKQPDWAASLIRYHRALIADAAGKRADARATFEKITSSDGKSLRNLLAYAQSLGNAGDTKGALKVLQGYFDQIKGEPHPYATDLRKRLAAGERTPLLVANASQGLSEAFLGLGEALAGEGGVGPGAMFLQFALYLEPRSPFALAALANIYENTKNFERAIDAYEQITPGTPLEEAIDIQKAFDLSSLQRYDVARALLDQVAEEHPEDLKPLDALGSIMREEKRWDESIAYYSRAIDLIKKPEKRHWTYYYARGTSYERVHNWPAAEADLQMALKLNPDEPTVLNFLGYSWVDQKRNLKQGLQLIEKAVRLKSDDGFIVDSLGWAHFRMGEYKEAVRWLEKAVELRPDDPVLNDHFGDGLWRVGREREAMFQWYQALTLNPEPDDAAKIRDKLKNGLPPLTKATAAPQPRARNAQRNDPPRKRAESKSPNAPWPQ